MNVEVLVSTMHYKDNSLLEDMNIKKNALVINQCNKDEAINSSIPEKNIRVLSFVERGLSKSRNRALNNATGDLCIIADDDMYYYEGITEEIADIAKQYPDVSVYVFKVDNHKDKYFESTTKLNFFTMLKVSSVQIVFNRKHIIEKGIKFNEMFGAGSQKYLSGEENIFLNECLKKGLKVCFFPLTIGRLRESVSTWFSSYDEKFFYDKGALFYELSSTRYPIMIFAFALKKQSLYRQNYTVTKVIKLMLKGANDYKREKAN